MRTGKVRRRTALVGLLVCGSAFGQSNQKSPPKTTFLGMWSIKLMVDQASTNIARRYNLNEQQEKYTRALMANRVETFIHEHGDTFERLAAEILRAGVDPSNPPSKEAVQGWGRKALPLVGEIRKAILDGNATWREILSDPQKKVHDYDLSQMTAQFTAMEKQFQRWQAGQYIPGEGPFTGLTALARQSEQIGEGPYSTNFPEHAWDYWVKGFIRKYELDKAQIETANAILKECKERAAKYRESHKAEIEAAKERLVELLKNRDREKIKETRTRINDLNKPIADLFGILQERVNKIPTESQRAAHEQTREAADKKATVRSKSSTKPVTGAKPARKPATIK